MKTITLAQIKALKPCSPDQVELFRELFGASTKVTAKKVIKYADKFNWNWLAKKTLSPPLWAEYERQRAPLWAELYLKEED